MALSETVDDIRLKTSSSGGAVLAQLEEQAVGSAQFVFKDHYVYIGRVSVLPAHRGKRIGQLMVRYIEALAKHRGASESRLEVRLSVPGNLDFYHKLGYKIVEKHAYPDEADFWYVLRNSFVSSF